MLMLLLLLLRLLLRLVRLLLLLTLRRLLRRRLLRRLCVFGPPHHRISRYLLPKRLVCIYCLYYRGRVHSVLGVSLQSANQPRKHICRCCMSQSQAHTQRLRWGRLRSSWLCTLHSSCSRSLTSATSPPMAAAGFHSHAFALPRMLLLPTGGARAWVDLVYRHGQYRRQEGKPPTNYKV
jgi:hypothetical protein